MKTFLKNSGLISPLLGILYFNLSVFIIKALCHIPSIVFAFMKQLSKKWVDVAYLSLSSVLDLFI